MASFFLQAALLLAAFGAWQGSAEVLENFLEVPECARSFHQKLEPTGLRSNRTECICQRLEGVHYYATLYDVRGRIPIYSAYILETSNTSRPDISSSKWYLEPMLSGLNSSNMEKPSSSVLKDNLHLIREHQAVNDDYRNSGYTRGHLNPSLHHSSQAQLATFTYTNMAPQESQLNSGTWNQYENYLKTRILPACIETHVLMGTVPSGAEPGQGVWIKERVNVPRFFWGAFCCLHKDGSWLAEARLGHNANPYEVKTLMVSDLEKVLSWEFGKSVSIFPNQCTSSL
ncbi:endonuclease domain-containing 1 protein-like [Ambystoma mexicanum]|uniref:endonuclease domain-containing 1 protein-like n=1 Tax=Ambystoma mexicanum TaxID=8296 RepID=UPI0037E799EF